MYLCYTYLLIGTAVNNVYYQPDEENNMSHPQNGKRPYTPSEQSLKKTLANSGYSKVIADKIWKWYNPTK